MKSEAWAARFYNQHASTVLVYQPWLMILVSIYYSTCFVGSFGSTATASVNCYVWFKRNGALRHILFTLSSIFIAEELVDSLENPPTWNPFVSAMILLYCWMESSFPCKLNGDVGLKQVRREKSAQRYDEQITALQVCYLLTLKMQNFSKIESIYEWCAVPSRLHRVRCLSTFSESDSIRVVLPCT
jgi:hypothetical protein